jgi:protein required for attachment to host cells
MFMQTTWIIAADSTRARIFEAHGTQEFHEIEDLLNPAGRESDRDINTDAKGRFYGKGERHQGHTAEPDIDASTHQTELFSKHVTEYLDKARVEHRYDELFLIAYPKFLGMLRENLSKEAQKLIKDEIPKDISKLGEREIHDFYVQNRLH